MQAIKSGLFISFLCRVPLGRSSLMSECHGTTPSACTVLIISHPVGVINRSPLLRVDSLEYIRVIRASFCLPNLSAFSARVIALRIANPYSILRQIANLPQQDEKKQALACQIRVIHVIRGTIKLIV